MKSPASKTKGATLLIDLNKLSYRHRDTASGLLVSKANGFADSAIVLERKQKKGRTYVDGEKAGQLVDVGAVMAAIAYYDMALLLMRPFDPNYSTVANWKCNALCKLRQFEDAAIWYAEIIRLDEESHGGAPSGDATAKLAREQLGRLKSKKNAPLRYRETDTNDFADPPFTLYAFECVTQLAKGKYADASLYFEVADRKKFASGVLKKHWKQMVGDTQFADLSISLESHLFECLSRFRACIPAGTGVALACRWRCAVPGGGSRQSGAWRQLAGFVPQLDGRTRRVNNPDPYPVSVIVRVRPQTFMDVSGHSAGGTPGFALRTLRTLRAACARARNYHVIAGHVAPHSAWRKWIVLNAPPGNASSEPAPV